MKTIIYFGDVSYKPIKNRRRLFIVNSESGQYWSLKMQLDDDVIKWKHFPRYWPFVRGIHRSLVNSLHRGQWRGALMFSLICDLNKRLSKQWWGWWSPSPSRSLLRHCNVLLDARSRLWLRPYSMYDALNLMCEYILALWWIMIERLLLPAAYVTINQTIMCLKTSYWV